ncbi:DUF4114 domain-containing protein [Sagittula stellata]|uniref:VCBS n=1 Tax=Sagittula stellata (strain ATCC 700073 / DSM 11524 / E-37) TaxID=388399 RepID=A3K0S4_SAGS3|nr:DUF4114 domain-containing protein [Sagittula stellata]EBA09389.1 VCBS [Sagittula stellata E-37]
MPTPQDTIAFGATQWFYEVNGTARPNDIRYFDLGNGRVLSSWWVTRNPLADQIPSLDDGFTGVYNSAYYMIRDIDGTEIVPPTLMDPAYTTAVGPNGNPQMVFAATPTPTGEIVLHYGIVDTIYPPVMDHYTVTVSANGTPGAPVAVPSNSQYILAYDSVLLSNGNAAVVSEAGVTVIDSTGAIVGTSGSYGGTDDWKILETSDGRLMVITAYGARASADTNIKGQFFDLTGAPLAQEFDIAGPPATPSYAYYVDAGAGVTELTDGRFVVAWGEEGSSLEGNTANAQSGIHVVILNSDGTIAKGPFLGNPDAQSMAQFEPTVFALADGGFAIGYESDDVVGTITTQYRIQLFDAAGDPVGPSYHPDAYTLSGPEARGQQEMVILPDGRGLVIDELGGSTVIEIGNGIVAGNTPPVTPGFTGTTDENTPFTGQLIATDADGDPLTFVANLIPALNDAGQIVGNAVVNSDGSFTFTPGYPGISPVGTARFTYTVSDGVNTGVSGTAVFTVTAGSGGNPTNTAPVPGAVVLNGTEDTAIAGQATATDADNDALTYALGATAAAHGTATITSGGAISYQPDADFFGSDSFDITVSDGTNAPVTTSVTVNVAGAQDVPVAQDGSGTVVSGNALTTALSAFDADGDTLVFALDSGPANGSVTVSANGSAVYTPDAGFSGSDSFVFRVSDGTDTDTGTVFVQVDAAPPPAPMTLAALNGTTITGLQPGGRITVTDATGLDPSDLVVDASTGSVTFGGVQFQVTADLAANSFVLAEAAGGGFDLILLDELEGNGSDLGEGTAVSGGMVNGLGPDGFFTGNGTRDYTVTLDASTSAYDNAIGAYVRRADGSISDVQVLFADAKAAGAGATATMSNIVDDGVLEFFFIQNAASAAAGLSGPLSIDASGNLLEGGVDTGLTTYFSEVGLNADGTEHFLSGAVDGGGGLRVGIEDLTGGGDMDYQDMVFVVAWTDDGI